MAGTKFALSGSCGQTDFSALLQFPTMPQSRESEIVACRVTSEIQLDAANPAKEWQSAQPVRFDADWQGRDSDRALETEVRVRHILPRTPSIEPVNLKPFSNHPLGASIRYANNARVYLP